MALLSLLFLAGGILSVLLVVQLGMALAGGAVLNTLYAATLLTFRPTPYLLLAALSLVGVALIG